MMNREFVMLAQQIEKQNIGGYYVSIKLDGQRAFWDGGISRNVPKNQVPWANTAKDERYVEPPIATGLWSRYGNVIHAPEYFLNNLPKDIMLDGELYLGRGKFQECRTIVSTIQPGPGWKNIKYRVFDMPSPNVFFQGGKINNPQFHKFIDEAASIDFWKGNVSDPQLHRPVITFTQTVAKMRDMMGLCNESWSFLNQLQLPRDNDEALEKMYDLLNQETDKGGEGLMIRKPDSLWIPKRTAYLLKAKRFDEGEALIVGSVTGLGKHLGRMGALIVQHKHPSGKVVEFQLSGFTDEERQLEDAYAMQYATDNPGTILLAPHECKHFKKGQRIRFRHRSWTDDAIPREARYWR